ncbi:hemicentin-1-like [Vespula maculifrons]|uniref:Hemicentin-1-like n=1 Tax=Vespula maculifrons TaxID=7453 RepID=A0ABD2CB24_VESMC
MKERIRRHSIEALASSNGQTVKKLTFLREYHTSTVIAEVVVPGNGNVLDTAMTNTTAIAMRTSTAMMKPLDIQLPPTLPMTFATENATTISAQSGSTALLPCVVHNLGDGVSTLVYSGLLWFTLVYSLVKVSRFQTSLSKA